MVTIITYLFIMAFVGLLIIAPIIGLIAGLVQLLAHPVILDTIDWFRENLPKQWAEIKRACEGFRSPPRY